MIQHLLKLAWNRRKKNTILAAEILISFLVLFAVFCSGVSFLRNYMQDRGFNYERIYVLSLDWQNCNNKQVREKKEQIFNLLKQNQQIELFSIASSNIPYNDSQWRSSFQYKKTELQADVFYADDNFFKLMGIKITNGRGFSKEDATGTAKPIIVNNRVTDKMDKTKPILSQTFSEMNFEKKEIVYKIVGTFENYKYYNDFSEIENQIFRRVEPLDTVTNPNTILIKLKTEMDAVFEHKLHSDLSHIAPDWTIDISSLNEKRQTSNMQVMIPFIIFAIIAGFLIFNVALGIFGVLWYSINQRKSEIGLRRALGASEKQIRRQFIGEVWMLSFLILLVGVLIAVQFPILGAFNIKTSIYMESIFLSLGLIYLLITLCALYPSSMAAKILPANSLREE